MLLIDEKYLDECLSCLVSLNDDNEKVSKLFSTMHGVFILYLDSVNKELKLENSKENLIYYILNEKKKDPNIDIDLIFDNISLGKFSEYLEELKNKKQEISLKRIDQLIHYLEEKRKLLEVFAKKDKIKNLIDNIETGDYTDVNEVVNSWHDIITQNYTVLMDIEKSKYLETASTLDLHNDSYSSVFSNFRKSVIDNIVDTGYKFLRKRLLSEGFSRRRIYLFFGQVGIGKSTLLINFLINAIKNPPKDNNSKRIFLYITAENLIDESLIRFYSALTRTPVDEIIKNIKESSNYENYIKKNIDEILDKYNCNVIFHYVEAKKTTVYDVESIIQSYKEQGEIHSLYIDYLDLFRNSNSKKDRHEDLGDITTLFKGLAVHHDIPVLTVSQLNRSGYDSDTASMTQVGKSIEKVEDADFVGFLQRIPDRDMIKRNNKVYKDIKFTIMKNRSGGGLYESCIFESEMQDYKGSNIFNFRMDEYKDEKYYDELEDGDSFDESDESILDDIDDEEFDSVI